MYQITHFIVLGSPGVPELAIQCKALPMTPGALQQMLEAALDKAVGVANGKAVEVLGMVVPVVSDGLPDAEMAAAIAWLTFHGRMQAIDGFSFSVDTRLQPIVDRVMALKADIPAEDAHRGGISLRM